MLKGLALSHWQSDFDAFNSVDFAIIKVTEGVGYVDPACDKLYQKAKKAGKLLGVYHFARPDLGNSAIEEADWFIKNIQGYLREAILVLDWESGCLDNVEWVKTFLDRVQEKTGVNRMRKNVERRDQVLTMTEMPLGMTVTRCAGRAKAACR